MRPPRGTALLPVVLRFVEDRAVVTGFMHPEFGPASGLVVGDVLESIDGRTIGELVTELRPFYAASNEPRRLWRLPAR